MEDDKYIKCNYCNRKYINDEDNIKVNFGCKKNGNYYKTCLKNKDRRKGVRRIHYHNNKDDIKEPSKQYRDLNKDVINKRINQSRREEKRQVK